MKFIAATSALVAYAAAECVDMTFGYTDATNDGCEWYDNFPSGCGAWDTDRFFSERMCCACGGGIQTEDAQCKDTNKGLGDLTGDKCDWYDRNPEGCGFYDTEEFQANSMCCACQGGCRDAGLGRGDIGGDACSWYDSRPEECGNWDTDLFKASERCCACDGGYRALSLHQVCWDTNNGAGDVTNDGCDWYERNPGYCGSYDTESFKAQEMCCTCGGGSSGSCYDTNEGHGDTAGDKCEWYNANPRSCGNYDTAEFIAGDMCCICGGGTSPNGQWTLSLSGKFARGAETRSTSYTTYAAIGGTVLAAAFCANFAFKAKTSDYQQA